MAAKGLMENLESKGESFAPYNFVNIMRQVFPMFDEKDDKGHHKQQDADECYSQFLTYFSQAFKMAKQKELEGDAENEEMIDDTNKNTDAVERLFGIDLESTIENQEMPDEKEIKREHVLKLSCHIDNNNKPIDNINEGLELSLVGDLEKHSDALQRNAIFKKTSRVNKLPGYLCVQFVRFYWKKESTVAHTKAGKAKILRSVVYPRVLDIYSFCSDELKKSLDFGREFESKLRQEEDVARLEGKVL